MRTSQAPWGAPAERVAPVCRGHPRLVGVYVHGSAALGGFTATSDLDVLVVADVDTNQQQLGRKLLDLAIDFPLELSIVTSAAPWPYRVHVATPDRIVTDHGEGDPDLSAHAVIRQTGIAVRGLDPATVIGAVPRVQLLSYRCGELALALDHAEQRYAALNACRAQAYAIEGVLLSKMDGGRWWMRRTDPASWYPPPSALKHAGGIWGPAPRQHAHSSTTATPILNQHR